MSDDAAGEARLAMLWLPDLHERSVLDVGTGSRLHRAFAEWSGAARFEAAADPGSLPDSSPDVFDVILVASPQPEGTDPWRLIAALVSWLSPRGVLVVDTQFLTGSVKPGEDETLHGEPPGEEVRVFCKDNGYTFRFVWRSDSNPGSVIRHDVFHIGRPVRSAWLLLAPSTSGKTTKSERLATMPRTHHVRTDRVLADALTHPETLPPSLQDALDGVHPWTLNLAYDAIVEGQLEGDLAQLLLRDVPDDVEPILDLYLPDHGHARFVAAVQEAGFNPVLLSWPHPIEIDEDDAVESRLAAFCSGSGEATPPG